MFDFPKGIYLDEKAPAIKSVRDRSPLGLLNSPAIMTSGISTRLLPENPNKICKRIKLILQGKQAGNNSDFSEEEIVAIALTLLEYKCIFTKQREFLLLKCLS